MEFIPGKLFIKMMRTRFEWLNTRRKKKWYSIYGRHFYQLRFQSKEDESKKQKFIQNIMTKQTDDERIYTINHKGIFV